MSRSGLGQTFTGIAPLANNSSHGNITSSFGSTVITDVFLTFGNNAGAPRYQDIAIGDVALTPVPEINPAVTASMRCLLAPGLAVFMQRRARAREDSR